MLRGKWRHLTCAVHVAIQKTGHSRMVAVGSETHLALFNGDQARLAQLLRLGKGLPIPVILLYLISLHLHNRLCSAPQELHARFISMP